MAGGADDLVGLTLAGRYEVLELLGAGGMGAVYRAHDRELDEVVALKGIHAELAANPAMVERFRREVKLARKVTHRNVARTFELVHSGPLVFCTMEMVAGESLSSRMKRERLNVEQAAWITSQVCDALAAAHAVGVVHRDIKPDNILLAYDGRVVLADFGVAAVTATNAGEVSGTPIYMAPEQARGELVTPAADVYALGVVLYEMLSGRRPFSGPTQAVLAAKQNAPALRLDEVDAGLSQVIAQMTAPDPAHRTTDMTRLSTLLAPWADAGAPSARLAPEPAALLHDVIVVAPTGDQELLHLAHGVYEELLPRLARERKVRVLPRAHSIAATPTSSVVELQVNTSWLTATIRTWTHAHDVTVPLQVAHLHSAAELLATGIVGQLHRSPIDPTKAEATDLLLRAEIVGRGGMGSYARALEIANRARELLPHDPAVIAAHALAVVREAIVHAKVDDLERASHVVQTALAHAPDHAEVQLAAGHVAIHAGNAPLAATYYRAAIACSRYLADAHEGLGRLLLEAGFLEQGFARIADALAIAPTLSTARWEVAKAYALERRTDDYARMVTELATMDRPIFRWRMALYTNDRHTMTSLADRMKQFRGFEPEMMAIMVATGTAGREAWIQHRERAIEIAETAPRVARRRSALAQFAAEMASYAGDDESAIHMIQLASANGLIDRHWLERCPLLDGIRDRPELARIRAQVAKRADSILDALYGDLEPETVVG